MYSRLIRPNVKGNSCLLNIDSNFVQSLFLNMAVFQVSRKIYAHYYQQIILSNSQTMFEQACGGICLTGKLSAALPRGNGEPNLIQ